MCLTECEQPSNDDRSSSATTDDNVISQQQKQNGDPDEPAACQLRPTTSETIDVLRDQLASQLNTIKDLRHELEIAKRREIDSAAEQMKDDTIAQGHSDGLALLELQAPVGDMLYAFLSYTLTSNEQSSLLDSLVTKNIITAEEWGQIRKLVTVEEKVLMVLSKLRGMPRTEIERWLSTVSTLGQQQLVEAKRRIFCK